MALLPTLRQKKRYILFEIVCSDVFRLEEISSVVSVACQEFLGTLGMSRAGVIFVKERFKPPFFVLRCNHTMVDEVRSSVIMIKKIKNSSVIIRSVTISGTLATVGSRLKNSI